jgi:hypothetical protein
VLSEFLIYGECLFFIRFSVIKVVDFKMNGFIWQIGWLVALVVFLWTSSIYGEKSTKPLWLAWAIPSLILAVFLLVIIFIKIPLQELNNFFLIVGGYYIFIIIALGGVSYWIASRARGIKNRSELPAHKELIALTLVPGYFWVALLNNLKSPKSESLLKFNPYYLILLMLTLFFVNVWERYFKYWW